MKYIKTFNRLNESRRFKEVKMLRDEYRFVSELINLNNFAKIFNEELLEYPNLFGFEGDSSSDYDPYNILYLFKTPDDCINYYNEIFGDHGGG